jgi:cytochrome bd-type quinol oxidase subunit 2
MATKHFFKGLIIFMIIIVLGLIVYSVLNNFDKGVTAGTDVGNKAEVAK